MLVHLDDHSMPQFPEWWHPLNEEPIFLDDGTVVWVLGREE